MASKTETAILGLLAVITAAAGDDSYPAPSRNQELPTQFKPFGPDGLEAHANLWDGRGAVTQETLGAQNPGAEGYEIEHRCEFEWIVAAGDDAAREAAHDRGLVALSDAIDADRTLGGALGEGGWAAIESIERSGSGLVTDGLPNVKACNVVILLNFISTRPF